MADKAQPYILPGIPRVGRYLSFRTRHSADPQASKDCIASLPLTGQLTVGLGEPLLSFWGSTLESLRSFPALTGPGVQVPSTQQAVWCWLGGEDSGELVKLTQMVTNALKSQFVLESWLDGFKVGDEPHGKDLTGYEDGTENPSGDDAIDAAFVSTAVPGMAGSSFVAVQQWVHNLEDFSSHSQAEQDNIIGRRISDNTEITDAPDSAHVKRTEQESFDPHAILLRRSMPFSNQDGDGLMFVAFGKSLDAFEVQLRRMCGLEDGVTDALFQFSRPVSGGYYWCPPVIDGKLDLRAVGS